MKIQTTDTPLRLLAQYRPIELGSDGPREQKAKALEVAADNLLVTVEFCDTQVSHEGTELFETVMEVRAQALAALQTKKDADRSATLKDFNERYEKFRTQYDNFKASVRHIFWLEDRELYPRVQDAL
jgi:hypothetical protein